VLPVYFRCSSTSGARLLQVLVYFRVTDPEVTAIEVRPALDSQAVRSCAVVWPENAVAVEPAPWSAPANEPVTLAVAPGLGRVNPSPPEGPVAPP